MSSPPKSSLERKEPRETDHEALLLMVRARDCAVLSALSAPLKFVPGVRKRETSLMASATTSPLAFWLSIVTATWPPLRPSRPHLSAFAERKMPLAFDRLTPSRKISERVFVILKSGPVSAVREPRVILKTLVPVSASPEKL